MPPNGTMSGWVIDMGQKHNINPKQASLMDVPDSPAMDVSGWAGNTETRWHASDREDFPKFDRPDPGPESDYFEDGESAWNSAMGHPLGIHMGSAWSANDRVKHVTVSSDRVMHPLRVTGEFHPDQGNTHGIWDDEDANGLNPETTQAVRRGENIKYENSFEDPGSVSIRAPRKNVQTWSDWVLNNPGEAGFRARRAVGAGYELIYGSDGVGKGHKQPVGLTASDLTIKPEGRDLTRDPDTGELHKTHSDAPTQTMRGAFIKPSSVTGKRNPGTEGWSIVVKDEPKQRQLPGMED
jgi:hypothetical protein